MIYTWDKRTKNHVWMEIKPCHYCGVLALLSTLKKRCWCCTYKAVRIQRRAHVAVRKAIVRGELQPAKGQLCAYCQQRQAIIYEHRDYSKPLDVKPSCNGCNMLLGHAKLT